MYHITFLATDTSGRQAISANSIFLCLATVMYNLFPIIFKQEGNYLTGEPTLTLHLLLFMLSPALQFLPQSSSAYQNGWIIGSLILWCDHSCVFVCMCVCGLLYSGPSRNHNQAPELSVFLPSLNHVQSVEIPHPPHWLFRIRLEKGFRVQKAQLRTFITMQAKWMDLQKSA